MPSPGPTVSSVNQSQLSSGQTLHDVIDESDISKRLFYYNDRSDKLLPFYFTIRYPKAYDFAYKYQNDYVNSYQNVKGVDYSKIPALRLDINPNELEISYEKSVTRTMTMGGWVEQHWRDKLSTINAKGSTGGFVHEKFGLVNVSRSETRQYQIFIALLRFYQENGHIYSNKGNILLRGTIELFYEDSKYSGYFESFDMTESAEYPYRFEYSFNFKVEQEKNLKNIAMFK